MNKVKKYILISISAIILLSILSIVALQWYAKHTLADYLSQKIPPNIVLNYENLSVSILQGTVQLDQVSAEFSYKDSISPHTKIQIKDLVIDGVSYWQYFKNKTIRVQNIVLENPDLLYYLDKKMSSDTLSGESTPLPNPVSISEIEIKNGNFTLLDKETKDTIVTALNINFLLHDSKTDAKLINEKIPFTYTDYSFSAQDIYTDLGPYERMKVDAFVISDKELSFKNVSLEQKYDKRELSRIIKTERDHTTLAIPEVNIRNIDFGFRGKRFYFSAEMGEMNAPHLEIFRDKLVADDKKIKRLYSKVLRELPIDLEMMELTIKNGHIGYEELVNRESKAGRLTFDKIDATMLNISNTYASGGESIINVQAIFMENAPITLDWNFDVTNESDVFLAKGTFKNFDLSHVNSFLESNLRARAKGYANEIYFTISGNSVQSTGDFKMNYENFEFLILKKDRLSINKLFTAIGSLFLNDGSKTDNQGYRNGKIQVERDPTKSFFNYLWINVQDGVINTITGSEKKNK